MRSAAAADTSQQKQKKLIICIITTPYRALCKARDLYVRSVTRCGQPPAVSFASSSSFSYSKSKSSKKKQLLHRSFSSTGSSAVAASSSSYYSSSRRTCSIGRSHSHHHQEEEAEDYRELVRAASIRTLTDSGITIIDDEVVAAEMQQAAAAGGGPKILRRVPRSASVGITIMGRIDEERPFEVGADDEKQAVVEEGQAAKSSIWGKKAGGGNRFRNKTKSELLYHRSKSYAVRSQA